MVLLYYLFSVYMWKSIWLKKHFRDINIDLCNIYSEFQHTYDSTTHTHSHTLTLNSIWVIGHETDLVFTIGGLPRKTINLFHLYFYQQQGIIPSIYFSFNNHLLQNPKQHCQDYVFVDRVRRLTKHNEPLKCILWNPYWLKKSKDSEMADPIN